jgi:hypothetical protein
MNTQENNKLIAEFMGSNLNGLESWQYEEELQYHTSWDWLMPVVEKIDNLFGNTDEIDDMINVVHNAVLQFNRDITYKEVVKFIKEYNENERLNNEYISYNDAPYGQD